MPPSVAWALVETSTGYQSLWALSCALSWSSTTPGCTSAVRASASTSTTLFRYFELSMIRAAPTVWPHCEVPAPRGNTGTPSSTAIWMAMRAASAVRGTTTPTGSIW